MQDAFTIGCNQTEAAFAAGIAESTLRKYFDEHPDFKEHCMLLRSTPTLRARKTIYESLDEVGSAWKWLEKKDPEFANKSQVTHTFEVKQLTETEALIIKEADERLLLEGGE